MNSKLKRARNIAIGAIVMLVILIGAGIGYTWYMGENAAQNPQAFAVAGEAVVRPAVEPSKPDPTAKVGASVQMLTSPVVPGSNASVMIRTNPGATCVITVEYDKVPSKDSGLTQKTADEFGMVEWAWTVEDTTPLGKWPVTMTCANQKNSAMTRGDLEVVKTIEE
ncbi:MAG: hypothetical protein ABIR46_00725 [Candidatus Saccharimonadales bacterium]